jgi:hypothetical protein
MRDIFWIRINDLDTKQWFFKEEVVALSIEFSESSTISHVIAPQKRVASMHTYSKIAMVNHVLLSPTKLRGQGKFLSPMRPAGRRV